MSGAKFSQDLGITIIKKRLLTAEEAEKYKNIIPEADPYMSRQVDYLLNPADMPSAALENTDILCYTDGQDTYCRIAIELQGVKNTELQAGDRFIFEGKFFTLLNTDLALSDYFERNAEI